MRVRLMIMLCMLAVLCAAGALGTNAPREFNYQAVLLDAAGDPVVTQTQVIFAIYDSEVAKTLLWAETLQVVPDNNGAFTKILGEVHELQDEYLDGARWLGITVGTDPELTPRTKLVATPYSFRVATVDDADAGEIHGVLTLTPTTPGGDDAAIYVQNSSGANAFEMSAATDIPYFIARGPGGDEETVMTSTGVTTPQLNVQTQSAKGGDDRQCTGDNLLGDQQGNSAVGCANDLSTAYNSFAVGEWNTINLGEHSMAMGSNNYIGQSLGAFVIGAEDTVADFSDRCVLMGHLNYADGYENICIGKQNRIQGSNFSSILGGSEGTITSGYDNAILSGRANRISGSAQSIICGGDGNSIDSTQNLDGEQFFLSACIAGGSENIASNNYATISGGLINEARGLASTVGGGTENMATNRQSTVAGGRKNEALGAAATVGGGDSCMADGNYATVPGGGGNRAGGAYSFAAGINAKAVPGYDQCFVWNGAWDIDSFYTTAHQQFLINAPGYVGINTNTPGYPLTVEGVTYSTGGVRYPDGNVQTEAYLGGATNGGWTDDGDYVRLTGTNDSVGIGTSTPTEKLEVVGAIKASDYAKATGSILMDPKVGIVMYDAGDWERVKVDTGGIVLYDNGDADRRAELSFDGSVWHDTTGDRLQVSPTGMMMLNDDVAVDTTLFEHGRMMLRSGSKSFATTILPGSFNIGIPGDSGSSITIDHDGIHVPLDTFCYVIPAPAGWMPEGNNVQWSGTPNGILTCNGPWVGDSSRSFYAEAHIPEGAQITGFEYDIIDNSSTNNMTMSYYYQEAETGDEAPESVLLVSQESWGAQTYLRRIGVILGTPHTVEYDGRRSYYLEWTAEDGADGLGNVYIYYTIDKIR